MCGCGNQATSGPTEAERYLATPANAPAQEFGDKPAADAYVAMFGGGTVVPAREPAQVGN